MALLNVDILNQQKPGPSFDPVRAFHGWRLYLGGLALPLLLSLGGILTGRADPSDVRPSLMFAEYGNTLNRLIEISPAGKIVWEHRPSSITVIFDVLPNHHVLYAFGGKPTGVREIARDQTVLWEWMSACPQVLGMSRLPDGNVLVVEQGPCRVVEVNAHAAVVRTIPLRTSETAFHRQVRCLHRLANGHILAAHEGEGAVREVDASGHVVWEYQGVNDVFDALRLEGGNTLISCGTQARIIEVSPKGEVVWEFQSRDAPDLNLVWLTSIQKRKNGNLVLGNFLRGHEGKGAHAFEITRDKKVVWRYDDHSILKSITMVRVLDSE